MCVAYMCMQTTGIGAKFYFYARYAARIAHTQ